MKRLASGEHEACDTDELDRFEGEYPHALWPRRRDAQALAKSYAPSKYPTKQWPAEALLEMWCSPLGEARDRFVVETQCLYLSHDDELGADESGTTRPRVVASASTAALHANEPPGIERRSARCAGQDGFALDAAFPGKGAPRTLRRVRGRAGLARRASLRGARRALRNLKGRMWADVVIHDW